MPIIDWMNFIVLFDKLMTIAHIFVAHIVY